MNAKFSFGWGLRAAVAVLLAWSHAAVGQTFSSGSTGADGALNITSFGQTATVRPGGIYNYTTVNISGSIRYVRNMDNAPLVILATGDVTISGTLTVIGSDGANVNASLTGPNIGGAGGPGGFAGGNSGFSTGSGPTAGQGPGGGAPSTGSGAQGGSYGASASFTTLIPLFGGSGGGGGQAAPNVTGYSGGGGGGAVLIASSTRITVSGQIRANGGAVSGSATGCATNIGSAGTGGAIRLVAPEIAGAGNVQAIRGTGGCLTATPPSDGRIRLEASNVSFNGSAAPTPSVANAPGPVSPAGTPALANVPTLAVASIGGVTVPSTIAASYFAPDMALAPGTTNPVPVVLTATNTPVGAPTEVTLRMIPQSPGTATNIAIPAVDHTGTFASSTASVNVTLPVGQVTVLQAFAGMTLTGQTASLFPLIDGEPVERVMVAANQGEASTVSLVTKSGKEVRVDQLRAEEQMQVARAWQILKETRSE